MRAFLIHGDRLLPGTTAPSAHTTPYPRRSTHQANTQQPNTQQPNTQTSTAPISWSAYAPYTNVLWLAYLYAYLISHFPTTASSKGDKGSEKEREKELKAFRRETRELRAHLDPAAPRGVLSFPSAGEVVRFAVEAGWVGEGQVVEGVWAGEEGEGSWVGDGDGDGDGDGGDTWDGDRGDDGDGGGGDAGDGGDARDGGDRGDGDGDGDGGVVEREVGDGAQGKKRCEERCEGGSEDGLDEKAGQDGNGHENGQQDDDGHRNTPREGITEVPKSVEEPLLTRPSRRTRRGKAK